MDRLSGRLIAWLAPDGGTSRSKRQKHNHGAEIQGAMADRRREPRVSGRSHRSKGGADQFDLFDQEVAATLCAGSSSLGRDATP